MRTVNGGWRRKNRSLPLPVDGAEKENIENETFRRAHPVRIVGGPNLALLNKISSQLDEFIQVMKSCRPSIPSYEDRYSSVASTYPFEFFFPRKNSTDDGPDPQTWETTPDVLAIKPGRPLRPIYEGLGSAAEFPAKEPVIAFDPPCPPELPKKVELPSWSIKIVENQTGGEIDLRVDKLKKVYAKEIEEVERLQGAADALQNEIKRKWKEATEEQEITNIFIANAKLKVRGLKESVAAQFHNAKSVMNNKRLLNWT